MALWLRVRPGPTHEADALMWLQDQPAASQVRAAFQKVLTRLWTDAWKAGMKAAGEKAGDFTKIPDQVVADRIGRMAAKWLDEVTDTRMRRIAAILAKGGTAAELEAAIRAMMGSQADARKIVITEIARAMQAAAVEAYRAAGVVKVRWITRSGHPCALCIANEAAGAKYLGEPFPSGHTAPPAHPQCECALIPADD